MPTPQSIKSPHVRNSNRTIKNCVRAHLHVKIIRTQPRHHSAPLQCIANATSRRHVIKPVNYGVDTYSVVENNNTKHTK